MYRELKTFIAVVRHGSFSRAGASIGMTQSTVSSQIKRLEDELGYSLFDRTGRAAILNEAGKRAFDVSRELLDVYMRLASQGGSGNEGGELHVGAMASMPSHGLLARAIGQFREYSPGWRIKVSRGSSLNLLAQVDSGALDLAVIEKPPFLLPADLVWYRLVNDPFVLLVPQRLEKTPWRALLASEPFIRYDRNSFVGRMVDRFIERAGISVDEVVELDELPGVVELVDAGVGVAMVPHAGALRIPLTVSALRLGDEVFCREVGIVMREPKRQRAVGVEFARCLRCQSESL